MPEESLAPITELFRNRFLQVLRDDEHLSAHKAADLLSWKHSGFKGRLEAGGRRL